jgi:hypothetical protein
LKWKLSVLKITMLALYVSNSTTFMMSKSSPTHTCTHPKFQPRGEIYISFFKGQGKLIITWQTEEVTLNCRKVLKKAGCVKKNDGNENKKCRKCVNAEHNAGNEMQRIT